MFQVLERLGQENSEFKAHLGRHIERPPMSNKQITRENGRQDEVENIKIREISQKTKRKKTITFKANSNKVRTNKPEGLWVCFISMSHNDEEERRHRLLHHYKRLLSSDYLRYIETEKRAKEYNEQLPEFILR